MCDTRWHATRTFRLGKLTMDKSKVSEGNRPFNVTWADYFFFIHSLDVLQVSENLSVAFSGCVELSCITLLSASSCVLRKEQSI